MKKFNISYDIEKIEDKGSWQKNTAYKSEFIKKKLQQYPRIVWLDADSEVIQYPTYFDVIIEDIALYYENMQTLVSGTMLFHSNNRVMEVVNRWIENCKTELRIFEQKHLQFAVYGSYIETHKISVFFLPDTYNAIDGICKYKPVIAQYQAHRNPYGSLKRHYANI